MANIKYIRNEVVRMDWDAEGFYESKKNGFVAAVNIYPTEEGNVAVIFKDQKAFLLIDPESGVPAPREELFEAINEANKLGVLIEEYFEESYVELSNSVDIEREVASYYGLSDDDCDDILNRLDDLSGYYATITEDM